MLSSYALFANAIGDNEAIDKCMLSSYTLFANAIGDNEAIAGGSERSGGSVLGGVLGARITTFFIAGSVRPAPAGADRYRCFGDTRRGTFHARQRPG